MKDKSFKTPRSRCVPSAKLNTFLVEDFAHTLYGLEDVFLYLYKLSAVKSSYLQEVLGKSMIGRTLPSFAAQLLQFARSTPLLVSTLVGHKDQDHVRENINIVKEATMKAQGFQDLALQLADA